MRRNHRNRIIAVQKLIFAERFEIDPDMTGINFDSLFPSCKIIKYQVECIHIKVQWMEFLYKKAMCHPVERFG